MPKLIVSEFVTLDGVMEAPGGEPSHRHTGWVDGYFSDDLYEYKLREILEAGSHLLGRVTYESFAGAWPQREGEMAEKINTMPKYVVSTTLKDLEWNNSSLVEGGVEAGVKRLKEGDGDPILVAGSRTLLHELLRLGLVDELRLMVFPVTIGSGDRVFPDSPDKMAMKLADVRTFESGAVVLTYEPE